MGSGKHFFRGVLKVGQEIEIRPGLVSKDSEGLNHTHLLLMHVKVLVHLYVDPTLHLQAS